MSDDDLEVYLKDHDAEAVGALELIEHQSNTNRGPR